MENTLHILRCKLLEFGGSNQLDKSDHEKKQAQLYDWRSCRRIEAIVPALIPACQWKQTSIVEQSCTKKTDWHFFSNTWFLFLTGLQRSCKCFICELYECSLNCWLATFHNTAAFIALQTCMCRYVSFIVAITERNVCWRSRYYECAVTIIHFLFDHHSQWQQLLFRQLSMFTYSTK